MSPTVRKATTQDIDELIVIQQQVQQLHVDAVPRRYRHVTAQVLREWMESTLAKENWHVLVATLDSRVVGYVVVEIRGPVSSPFIIPDKCAAMDQLAVIASAQRLGVATKLAKAAENLARTEGCAEMILEVLEFNQGAQRFYEATGYSTLRRRMAKQIAP